MYWTPSNAMSLCMAHPVLCKSTNGVDISETNVRLYSGVKTQKRPRVTQKAAKRPARACRPNTSRSQHPGPAGATDCLVDIRAPAGWPWASHRSPLSLSVLLCAMELRTMPTSQGCCEEQTRQCPDGLRSLALAQPRIRSCCWDCLSCTVQPALCPLMRQHSRL